jgi:hypothetical protein
MAGYVPAHDNGRDAPRAMRADRFSRVRLGGPGIPPPPGFDTIAFASSTLAGVPWEHEVEVLLRTSPAAAAERFPLTLAELELEGEETLLRMRADSLVWVVGGRAPGERGLRF